MIRYLSRSDAAARVGLAPETIRAYDKRGYLPAPDAMVGRARGWLPETIDKWAANRLGQGHRSDLTNQANKQAGGQANKQANKRASKSPASAAPAVTDSLSLKKDP